MQNFLLLIYYPLHEVVINYHLWLSNVSIQILGNKHCFDNAITLYGDHINSPIMDHLGIS